MNTQQPLQSNRKRRVYIDGVFDLFHRGHLECLRKSKEFFGNDDVELIVGVISDEDATNYKRKPVFNEEDRFMLVQSVRYVDEAILGAPLIMTADFVNRHRIDVVFHGFSDIKDFNKQQEFYAAVQHIFYQIPYYKHINTSSIIADLVYRATVQNDTNKKE
jgi:cytidyltransferase-like protein